MTKIHYFYKITNNINGKFYYGVHNTNNINDGYMGSGIAIQNAYKKYGIENFTKQIIKYFSTSTDAFEYEKIFITEDLIKNEQCYNMKTGGDGWCNQYIKRNKVVVTDGISIFQIDKNDERYLSGNLQSISKGMVNVKDKDGNIYRVSILDKRYLSGEFVGVNKGRKLSDEHKKKLSESLKGKKKKQSQIKTCWIYKDFDNHIVNKKIKLNELSTYINDGWIKGRKTGELCLSKQMRQNGVGSICPICGNRFPKATGKIYCCKKCRDKAEGRDKYPLKIDVINKYNELKSWQKVADFYNLTIKIIRRIKNN